MARSSSISASLIELSVAPGIIPRYCTQIKIVGCQIVGRLRLGAGYLGTHDLRVDRGDDARRDAVLQIEDVLNGSVIAFSPNVVSACRLDEHAVDTEPAC